MNLKTIFLLNLFIAALLLSGCSNLKSLKDVNPNALQPNQSVLIVSAGAKIPCKKNTASMMLKKSSAPADLSNSIGGVRMNNAYLKSDFNNEYSRVVSIVVEPGKYNFWAHSSNPYGEYLSPILTEPFVIKSNEIVYLGEVYTYGCDGNFSIEINDKEKRDIDFIQKKYPDLKKSKITKRLLKPKY